MPKVKNKQASFTSCTLIVRQSEFGVKPEFCQIIEQESEPVVWSRLLHGLLS